MRAYVPKSLFRKILISSLSIIFIFAFSYMFLCLSAEKGSAANATVITSPEDMPTEPGEYELGADLTLSQS